MSPTNHELQLITIATLLLAFTALPATAQYQPRPQAPPKPSFSDEVTVTATGIETEVDEAPTAVTVVTRDEMDDAQADRVVDMLRRVPGLAVVGSGDAGKADHGFHPRLRLQPDSGDARRRAPQLGLLRRLRLEPPQHCWPAPGGGREGTLLRPVGS